METPVVDSTKVNLALTLTDAAKLPMLLELLRHIDFVETAEAEPVAASTPTAVAEEAPAVSAFHALAGIWAGRDITAEQLRQQAWGGRMVDYGVKL